MNIENLKSLLDFIKVNKILCFMHTSSFSPLVFYDTEPKVQGGLIISGNAFGRTHWYACEIVDVKQDYFTIKTKFVNFDGYKKIIQVFEEITVVIPISKIERIELKNSIEVL